MGKLRIITALGLLLLSLCSCSKEDVIKVDFEEASIMVMEEYSIEKWGESYGHCSVYLSREPYEPGTPLTIYTGPLGTQTTIFTPGYYSWIVVAGLSPDESGEYTFWQIKFLNAENRECAYEAGGGSLVQIIELNDNDFERILYRP